jgi:hypothetical protein
VSPDAAALPPHGPLLTTPTGAQVLAFTTPGDHALDWWQRLRDVHPTTGYWPVLLDADAPEHFADGYGYESPADARARFETLHLAWQYKAYNDGYYDFYFADNLTDLAASLHEAPIWRCWWD